MPTEEELFGGFSIGAWEVLPGRGELRRGERVERPEPKVFAVLLALAKRGSNLVTKQDLIDEVWDGRPTSDEPIARCLSQLRGHLDDRERPHQLIETLQRRGYRLKQNVRLHKSPETRESTTGTVANTAPRFRPIAALIVLIAIAAVAVVVFRNQPQPTPLRSIAVMPFENLGLAESDEYLVSGFKEELVVMLASIDDFTVKNVRREYPLETQAVARKLAVESVLQGTLRRNGDTLKISYQISNGADGIVVHSGDIEGQVDVLFSLQESLAVMVRNDLIGKSTQTLIKSRPSDSMAYDSYRRGMFALERRGEAGQLENAIALFDKAIRLDENYGPSYLALATVYMLMPNYRNRPSEEMDRLALETIEKGVAADSMIEASAGAIYGYVFQKNNQWSRAEASYQRAINADVVDSNAFNWYARMLASLGRLDASLAQALAAIEIDPTSPVVNSRTAMSYAWLMQTEKALEFYERSTDLGWNEANHRLSYALILVRTGDFEKALAVANGAVSLSGGSASWVEPVFAAMQDPTNARMALQAIDEAASTQQLSPVIELTARTLLGDVDGAMRIAKRLEEPGEVFQMDLLFVPELKALRLHPEFVPLMERLGVTDYWASVNCFWDDGAVSCPGD